jgi:excisionase family DNA binding protein
MRFCVVYTGASSIALPAVLAYCFLPFFDAAMPEYLTVSEVAQQLRLAEGTVYRLVARGRLPAVRLGRAIRFDPQQVARTLRLGRPEARASA